ncbi:sel1 repeat family protein [bacterium]|nr:sel1 repeat family protein [bacterium]
MKNIKKIKLDNKNGESYYNLGNSFLKKKSQENKILSIEYFEKAAKLNHTESIVTLASLYEFGNIVPLNLEKAIEYYKKAAKLKNPTAIINLSNIYIKKNMIDKSIELLKKSIKLKISDIYHNLAIIYLYNENFKNEKKAFNILKQGLKISPDDIDLLNQLGICYYYGVGTKINYKKSFNIFYKTALLNSGVAQFYIGLIYETGNGVKKDINISLDWYLKSANNNYYKAQHTLAYFYNNGINLKENLEKAIEYYKKASENGDKYSMGNLASIYLELGKLELAKKWALKAIENGYEKAEIYLGEYYWRSKKNKNRDISIKYWNKWLQTNDSYINDYLEKYIKKISIHQEKNA